MLKKLLPGLGLAVVLTGCATKDYVNEKTAELGTRTQSEFLRMDTQLASLDKRTTGLEAKTSSQDARLGKAEETLSANQRLAQEALERANAAHRLAEGKLLHQVTLTDGQIRFTAGGAKLDQTAQQVLTGLVQKLKADNRNVYIEIQGHTDHTGSAAANKQLGLQRAEGVRDFLYHAGIALHRLNVISYGSSQPAVPGKNSKARAQNRRVVLLVLV